MRAAVAQDLISYEASLRIIINRNRWTKTVTVVRYGELNIYENKMYDGTDNYPQDCTS